MHGEEQRKESLYDLMSVPLGYMRQLVQLTDNILHHTPPPHSDRLPLQMALTQLETLCEDLNKQRCDIEVKEKVKYINLQCVGLEKVC